MFHFPFVFTFTLPLPSSKIFSSFRSRCTIPFWVKEKKISASTIIIFLSRPIHRFTGGCLYYVKGLVFTGSETHSSSKWRFFSGMSAMLHCPPLCRGAYLWLQQSLKFVFFSKMQVNYLLHMDSSYSDWLNLCRLCCVECIKMQRHICMLCQTLIF